MGKRHGSGLGSGSSPGSDSGGRGPGVGVLPVTIRVVVADDQELVRAGFRLVLETRPGFDVVAEAADGEQAVEAALRYRPDVVLMDIRMPGVDGIAATDRITAGLPTKVIVLTTFDHDDYVTGALQAGASGFLLKDVRPADLADAIRVVASGDAVLAPAVTRGLIERHVRGAGPSHLPRDGPADARLAELTSRELEVFALVGRALSNSEIAELLYVSETTVKSHVSALLRKLRLRDRVQAVVLAYETGVMTPRPTPPPAPST
jgi:DNA-binding NarL/FixJ family response regulator